MTSIANLVINAFLSRHTCIQYIVKNDDYCDTIIAVLCENL